MLAAVNRSAGNARKKLLRLALLRRFIAANGERVYFSCDFETINFPI